MFGDPQGQGGGRGAWFVILKGQGLGQREGVVIFKVIEQKESAVGLVILVEMEMHNKYASRMCTCIFTSSLLAVMSRAVGWGH